MVVLLLFLFLLCFFYPGTAHAAAPSVKMLSTPSCPACARMSRVLDDLADRYPGKVTTEKINLHERRDLAKEYNVRYVPHTLFLDAGGSVFSQKTGALSLDEVLKTFSEAGLSIE